MQAGEREEYNQRQQDKRHRDKRELTDTLLSAHGFRQAPDIVEQYIAREAVNKIFAILQTCTPTQKRRFLLYSVYGFTYEKIALLENCNKNAVFKSVNVVQEKIKKVLF